MIDVDRFVEKRRARWKRLEALLDEAQDASESQLGPGRLQELLVLYRSACADLNQARALTANPQLLGSINQLVGRAYRFVYRGRTGTRLELKRFFLQDVPATFRRERRWVRLASASLVLGAALGFAAALLSPAEADSLIPAEMLTARPRERADQIEAGKERIDSVSKATEFGSFLYTHNIQVSFLTFALGALTFVGGFALLFYNGVLLGAVAARYALDGAGTFFVAWVGPHGALEIPSIVFAGAAGLLAGRALLLPGDRGRAAALRESFPAVFRMLCTCAVLLVGAGLIEGSFSQMSAKSVPYAIKTAVAAALFCGMYGWLFLGRREESSR